MMTDDKSGMTTDRLRKEIDEGQAGDKVAFSDPAAAPLGTDAEAGGHSPTPEEISMAAAHEVTRPTDSSHDKPERTIPQLQGSRISGAGPMVLIAAAVLLAVLAAAFFLS